MATHSRSKDGVNRDKRNKQSGYSKPGGNMCLCGDFINGSVDAENTWYNLRIKCEE